MRLRTRRPGRRTDAGRRRAVPDDGSERPHPRGVPRRRPRERRADRGRSRALLHRRARGPAHPLRPLSELSRLNADRAPSRRVSRDLGAAVRAAIGGAARTGGLVDPTLLGALERAGYAASRAGTPAVGLRAALRDAPPRRPGAPDPAAAWRAVAVAPDLRSVRRPPGVRIDLGGIGKGLAADAAARLLPSAARYAVDCGGDLALGGSEVDGRPWTVDVRSPWGGEPTRILVRAGGVATSGLDVRLWRAPDGTPRHHLLDPATGAPAWTGVIAATALGATAVDAEIDAKAALLAGATGAIRLLRGVGGAVVLEGEERVRLVGLAPAPIIRVPHRAAA
jgi:FAD:protein FMN transferase